MESSFLVMFRSVLAAISSDSLFISPPPPSIPQTNHVYRSVDLDRWVSRRHRHCKAKCRTFLILYSSNREFVVLAVGNLSDAFVCTTLLAHGSITRSRINAGVAPRTQMASLACAALF
ncbi:hypothetical protein EI94DRAFT_818448 [Lactarius quietus]|nr:hypothetical protein EI94DRAFT_818448 [Lactarius quietus]